MISEESYRDYLSSLLTGDQRACHAFVTGLLEQEVDIKTLYIHLFQRSLYEIGDMWERRKISVAVEHMASAITESLLPLVYPLIFSAEHVDRSAVICCAANEFHQIGGKMVADYFELQGWNGYFLGANTPENDLLQMIDDKQPEIIGLSLSVYFNLPRLVRTIESLTRRYPESHIIVGGQAFQHGGMEELSSYSNVRYLRALNDLDAIVSRS